MGNKQVTVALQGQLSRIPHHADRNSVVTDQKWLSLCRLAAGHTAILVARRQGDDKSCKIGTSQDEIGLHCWVYMDNGGVQGGSQGSYWRAHSYPFNKRDTFSAPSKDTGINRQFLAKKVIGESNGKMERWIFLGTMWIPQKKWCPRQESNLRTWIRNPMLYPLSYGGIQ